MRLPVRNLGESWANRVELATLVAAHLSIPEGNLIAGLFLAQEGIASLAGPGEATVKDSGCFVDEWQVVGSVQFKAERQIWLRFM